MLFHDIFIIQLSYMAEPVWFLTSIYKYQLIVPQINKIIVFLKKIIVFIKIIVSSMTNNQYKELQMQCQVNIQVL